MNDIVIPKEEVNPIIGYIIKRINSNKNVICITIGATGSGKSFCNLKFAEVISKQFNNKFDIVSVCFSPLAFMTVLNSIIKQLKEGIIKKGSVIILEESGILMGSRNWNSINNKMMGYVLQSFRSLNVVLMMNLPSLNFLDVQGRSLAHILLETQYINKEEEVCVIKPLLLQNDSKSGKTYYKYLRYNKDGKNYVLKRLGVSKPSEELIKAYESKKSLFLEELNKKILDDMIKLEKGNIKKDKQTLLSPQEEIIKSHLNKGLNVIEIASAMKLSPVSVRVYMSHMKRKGWLHDDIPIQTNIS